jgi:uncharacterized protein YcfJ
MLRSRTIAGYAIAGILISAAGAGCQNNTQKGTAIGGLGGAAAGAIIGKQSGNTALGALIGGATGAVAGGLIGNAEDKEEERDEALRTAAHERSARIREERAITNRDIADFAANGVSDNVICNEIRTHGGRFDTSPQAIIDLQRAGVSDRVIQEMQNVGGY